MNNYFVEGHLGGYYISCNDPELIEEYCEQCGDHDMILFTFDDEEKDEPFKSLSEFFAGDLLYTNEKLIERISSCEGLGISLAQVIKGIKNDIVFEVDTDKDIIFELYESANIDKKTYNNLVRYLNRIRKEQLEIINNFDYSTIKFNKGNIKTKRKKR